jgi:cytochrome c5
MAAPELDDHIEEHSSFIRTPKQLLTVVVLAFVVPITILVMLAVFASGIGKYDRDHPAMTDEAIAQRIKPVGEVRLAEAGAKDEPAPAAPSAPAAAGAPAAATSATAPAAGAPAAAAATPTAAAAGDGKAIYEKVCTVCHGPGIAGAPKSGDKAAWEPRIKQGMEVLYTSSLKGKGAMPPKGGAADLSDAAIKAAVDYMVGLVK